jgi:hypothetical protein
MLSVLAVAAILTTPQFAFHSDVATNLNQTLIADFVARRDGRGAVFASGADQACFDRLPAAARAGWARAVEYYRTNTSTPGQRVLLRLQLAGIGDPAELNDAANRTLLEAFARARADADTAYRRCLWPAQDRVNRAWVRRLEPLLRAHAQALASQLPELFQSPWAGLPFRVDVVDYVGFSGGNTASNDAGQPHILVSSTYADNQGLAALEVVFHEAAHFLAQPGKPLNDALTAAGKSAGVTLPPDVLHQVHFFLVGEAVRRSLAATGQDYTPYMYSLKLFSDGFRNAAPRIWSPYVDGTRTLEQAAMELADAARR